MAETNYQMQYDEQGRPFFWANGVVGGAKKFVSPVAMGGQAPKDETGIFRSRPQWNQDKGTWETPLDWGNILNVGVGAGLGAGALSAAGAFGGGAAGAGSGSAAGGVLPSSSLPVGSLMGGPAAIASQGVSQGLGTFAANAGGGFLGGLGNKLLGNLTSMKGIGALASIIPALMSARNSGGGSGGGLDDEFVKQAYADAKRQNEMQQARYRRVDPLHEAVTQLAHSRLPVNVQRGELPRVPLPE